MSYKLQYGGYVFKKTFSIVDNRVINVVPQQKLARADGARTIRGSLGPRKIRVAGTLFGPTAQMGGVSDIRTELDNMYNALHTNAPSAMFVGRDDRYLRSVHCETLPETTEPNAFERIIRAEFDFVSPDPFFYSTTLYSDSWTVSGTAQAHAITPNGKEPPLPNYAITLGGAGAVTISIRLMNNLNGQYFDLTGSATGGDVINVNCLERTVTIGSTDRMDLFDGRWVPLIAGTSNTLAEAYTGTAITNITTTYRARYL